LTRCVTEQTARYPRAVTLRLVAILEQDISKKNASGGDKHPAPIFRGVRTKRCTYAVYAHAV